VKNLPARRIEKVRPRTPDDKFSVICWLDDLCIDTAHEVNDYLAENQCKDLLKTGGQIIGKSRAQFHKYTKKEVL